MDTMSFQDFVLKLSLHTSIIKHNSNPNHKAGIQKIQHNFPIAAKKLWKTVRVVYFMLRKNISNSKPKLLADLTMAMKRGKIAGKAAMHGLMPHHDLNDDRQIPKDEYEFSCSNTPAHPTTFRLPFHLNKRKRSPSPEPEPSDVELFVAAMEIVGGSGVEAAAAASPALPGFGRTPRVRQLRITDSPFPEIGEDDVRVDEAAEKFIMKFYRDLKRQNTMASS